MKSLLLPLLLAPALIAAGIDGTVVNKTTGKPQPNAEVTLMKLKTGMENAGTVKADASGHFTFNVEADPTSPYLVQAAFEGVNYNKMLPPGTPTTGFTVEVFNSSTKVPEAKVAQHAIFLQPGSDGLLVQEVVSFENSSNVTFNDPKGTMKFYLPPAAQGKVNVSVQGMQGMALQREAQKTGQPDVYSVEQAMKPGPTRFNIEYKLPDAQAFATRSLYKEPLDIVVPPGVSVEGDGVKKLGVHPQSQAALYRFDGAKLAVKVSGTPAEQPAAAAADDGSGGSSADDSGGIDVKKPLLYSRLTWVLVLTFGMLALGFALLYRKDVPAGKREA